MSSKCKVDKKLLTNSRVCAISQKSVRDSPPRTEHFSIMNNVLVKNYLIFFIFCSLIKINFSFLLEIFCALFCSSYYFSFIIYFNLFFAIDKNYYLKGRAEAIARRTKCVRYGTYSMFFLGGRVLGKKFFEIVKRLWSRSKNLQIFFWFWKTKNLQMFFQNENTRNVFFDFKKRIISIPAIQTIFLLYYKYLSILLLFLLILF